MNAETRHELKQAIDRRIRELVDLGPERDEQGKVKLPYEIDPLISNPRRLKTVHGKSWAYDHYGCRCEACVAAKRSHWRHNTRKRRQAHHVAAGISQIA